MAKEFASFPLNLVCFPGEKQNLHIFEPRYRDLIKDCRENNISFIIVPVIKGKPHYLGTEMKLLKVEKEYPDGKYDVTVKAINLLKVHDLRKNFREKAYPSIKGIKLSWDIKTDFELQKEVHALVQELYQILSIENAPIPSVEKMACFRIVHKLGLTLEQELTLLELPTEIQRLQYLIIHLKQFIPTVRQAENLKIIAALNGHYKNINPEKLS